MQIRDYGEVVLCKNITFEDNKYDVKGGHPGIVLLPTSDKDDYAYCLYMTSDRKRAQRENDKYIDSKEGKKKSYINLQQIIKIKNSRGTEVNRLEEEEFIELLEQFYNYQDDLEVPKQEFLEIKDKLKTLLEILKLNQKLGIEETITAKTLDEITCYKGIEKRIKMYATRLMLNSHYDKKTIQKECFTSEKDRIYSEKLIGIYNDLKEINIEKIDFNDLNNKLRTLYLDFKNKNYLMSADFVFGDLAQLCDGKRREAVNQLLEKERERLVLKQKAEEEKKEAKEAKEAARKRRAAKYNEKTSYRRYKSKYGNSEFFK